MGEMLLMMLVFATPAFFKMHTREKVCFKFVLKYKLSIVISIWEEHENF